MHCDEIRVLNFRSIKNQQTIPLQSGVVLIGPNNVGKSNLLRAVKLFFSGADPEAYSLKSDKPHQVAGRTSIRAMFTLGESDSELWQDYVSLHSHIGEDAPEDRRVAVYLEYSRAGTGSYKLFPNKRPENSRRADFSRKQSQFVQALLKQFEVRYVSATRDWEQFYSEYLVPTLGKVVESELEDQLKDLRKALAKIGSSIGERLRQAVDSELTLELDLPQDIYRSLGAVSVGMKDPTPTDLTRKGQGIQSAVLIASIGWISDRDRSAGKIPVWLLEEPEAYTHPELGRGMVKLIESASEHGPVIFTTHSLGLVPSNHTLVRGIDRDDDAGTRVKVFGSHAEATSSIRDALGVKAADYFGYGGGVVFTEGPSDVMVLKWALGHFENLEYPRLSQVSIVEFGGVKHLSGFLVGSFAILQKEVPAVALFDGDAAGKKEVGALARRLTNAGTRWVPGEDYVVLPDGVTIEGMFPQQWIMDSYGEEPRWFEEPPTLDMDGKLLGFKIRDQSKMHVIGKWMDKATSSGSEMRELRRLLDSLERALEASSARLQSAS